MKLFLRFIVILLTPLFSAGQITTPVIKAGFGVDGDVRARFFNGALQTSDDWFLLAGTPGTSANGEFVIDTTGAATIIAGYLTDISPWPKRMASFFRTMSKPQFSVVNNRLWLDAIFVRDYHGNDTTVFTSGSDKNGMSPFLWTGGIQGIPDKNDILDIFAHVRRAGPNSTDSLWMFGGLSLDNTTGNRYFDFEMYQTDIYYDRPSGKWFGYGPDAGHTSWKFDGAGNIASPGDIIFSGEFQSGTLTNIEARIWVKKSDWQTVVPTAFNWSGLFDGNGAGATYGYASISPKTAGAFYTGLGSPNNTWAGPFGLVLQDNSLSFTNPGPASTTNSKYIADQFIEFSVNLTKLGLDPVSLLGGDICGTPFNRIVVKTRASAAFTAELKDFVAPTDLFLAPRVNADADVPIFCGDTSYSNISVINPHPGSDYQWTTTDGHIVGPTSGASIFVDSAGTYIVTQRLMAGCAPYATDTVIISRVADCVLLSGYIKSFTGIYDDDEQRMQLNWRVLNNENINSFRVERSYDGMRFNLIQEIQSVPGITGEQTYHITDQPSRINEQPVFYRIKLINNDGSVKYSWIISIVTGAANGDGITIYPNPVKEYLQVNIYSSENSTADIAVIDMQGKIMKQLKENLQQGNNVVSLTETSAWQRGMYYVIVKIKDKIYRKKIIVTD